jgi:AcrR family transcriptional regulator
MKNKEETKKRLINAVGEILKNEGYSALGVKD